MLQKKYQSQAQAIASYNFSDIAEGTGMQLFYGGECSDSGGNTHILSGQAFYSQTVTISPNVSAAGSDSIRKDVDYDTEVNLPRTVNGKVLVNVTGAVSRTSGTGTFNIYFKVYVRRYDGTTETDIASNTSETHTTASLGNGEAESKVFAIEIDVDNAQIKVGEILRITIEMHGWDSQSAGGAYTFGQDPAGRADADYIPTDPTELKVWIPFRVEV